MGKLRHLALVVRDLEAAAQFYEKNLEMKRVKDAKGAAVYLSDGVMNLALLAYDRVNQPGSKTADGVVGLHHFGFKVDDLDGTGKRIEGNGGKYCYDFGDPDSMNYERKFRDPEGNMFDISDKGWFGALNE